MRLLTGQGPEAHAERFHVANVVLGNEPGRVAGVGLQVGEFGPAEVAWKSEITAGADADGCCRAV